MKAVAIAMSGGVDSSVVAATMLEKGYKQGGRQASPKTNLPEGLHCFGVHMKVWGKEPDPHAEEIAKKLGIPFYIIDLEKEFKKEVVDYYIDSYLKGETPNPCIFCNPRIKFGKLLEECKKLGADFIATGHYARIKGEQLHAGIDEKKDQSYFLYRLSKKQLSQTLFPLGDQEKTKTKKIARKLGLKILENKDESQGICFIKEKLHTDFLRQNLPEKYFKEGLIVDLEGNKLGRHKGLPHYTCGQRKGIRIGGPDGPYYVIGMDPEKNLLIVGKDEDLWRKEVFARDLHFISGEKPKTPQEIHARIRHLGKLEPATLEIKGSRAKITFSEPVRAFTTGQSIVFYKGTQVLGGGVMQ